MPRTKPQPKAQMIWDANQHMWLANNGPLSFIGWNLISRRLIGNRHLIATVVRRGIIRKVISKIEYVPVYVFKCEKRRWV
jgi:hypothetical protein